MSGFLELAGVEVRLGAFHLGPIDLTVEAGEMFVLLGASGAGKSVLLETIAGFHRPTAGRILVDGRDVTNLPTELRRVGLMFQDYALFPHRTVRENVAFSLAFLPNGERGAAGDRADRLIELLGLTGLADRRPVNLSGGEKQRVALARALAAEPELLLLDEPLSALDERSRGALRDELLGRLRSFGVTSVFVTHDRTEALEVADRLAVIDAGALLQVGPPEEVFYRPRSLAVARFVGCENILTGAVLGRGSGGVRVALLNGSGGPARTEVVALEAADDGIVAGQVAIAFRAEDVSLWPEGRPAEHPIDELNGPVENRWSGRVEAVTSLGPLVRVKVLCPLAVGSDGNGHVFPVTSLQSRQVWRDLALGPGDRVSVSFASRAVNVLPLKESPRPVRR